MTYDPVVVINEIMTRMNSNLDPTEVIQAVRDGMRSVRSAAAVLDCTTDEIQMAAWGKICL